MSDQPFSIVHDFYERRWKHPIEDRAVCGACAVDEIKPKLCACGHPATDHAPVQTYDGLGNLSRCPILLCGRCARCVRVDGNAGCVAFKIKETDTHIRNREIHAGYGLREVCHLCHVAHLRGEVWTQRRHSPKRVGPWRGSQTQP